MKDMKGPNPSLHALHALHGENAFWLRLCRAGALGFQSASEVLRSIHNRATGHTLRGNRAERDA